MNMKERGKDIVSSMEGPLSTNRVNEKENNKKEESKI